MELLFGLSGLSVGDQHELPPIEVKSLDGPGSLGVLLVLRAGPPALPPLWMVVHSVGPTGVALAVAAYGTPERRRVPRASREFD